MHPRCVRVRAPQPDVNVGKCWPMDGSSGRITIRVSDVGGVIPTHFSIDHAHHDVAHSLASAPRNCEAWVRTGARVEGFRCVTHCGAVLS